MDKRLTFSELNHLQFCLEEVRRTGSYYGSLKQFIARQTKLERWIVEQVNRPIPSAGEQYGG